MPIPTLADWPSTSQALHQAARVLGAVRLLTHGEEPLYLELALAVRPEGLSSDALPQGGEVVLDFKQAALVYTAAGGQGIPIPLSDHTQASLLEKLLETLAGDGAVSLSRSTGQTWQDSLFAALSESGRRAVPAPEVLSHDTPLHVNRQTASDYAGILYAVFTGLARWRARLSGMTSPLVVWPHHFDLSGLWFLNNELDDWQPHLNFGFAPFSDGLARPYLYAYAYPYPTTFTPPPLPVPARWHTEGWQGVVLSYDDMPPTHNLAEYVEQVCQAIYASLLPLILKA